MCGRFTLKTSSQALATLFDDLDFPELKPRYNIAPTQMVLGIRSSATATLPAETEAVFFRWGLVPFWAKDLKIGASLINARAETVSSKPSFRNAFNKRRCLILADGFYEWKKGENAKIPQYITRVDEQPFCFAGLWESWTNHATQPHQSIETCTIITTTPNELMAKLHDRMPVILDKSVCAVWLDTSFQDHAHLQSLLVPCPAERLKATTVSNLVNKPIHDSPECIAPVARQ